MEIPAGTIIVEVHSATQVEQFLPFTPLTARYHGKRVALVILADDDLLPESGDLFSDPAIP